MSAFLITPDLTQKPAQLPPHPYTFPLDPFQEHALCAIAEGANVLVCAKTGSGKTLVGEYQIYHSTKQKKRVFYTTPIKSLSNQKFHDLKTQFPEQTVGIMTGDIKFCPHADIVVLTTEILRNLLYKKGTATEHLGLTASLSLENVDAVIFDECHYMNDRDRGKVWEETMILLPREIHMVLLSATLDRPDFLASWLGDLKQKPIYLLETQYRVVPLTHYVLSDKDEMITIMDAKETYYGNRYKDWLQAREHREKEERAFQREVIKQKEAGTKGGVQGKVREGHFVHRMNHVVALLEKKELLPALFFVLSRKQCEEYAQKVEHTLLDTSDTATVKHLITFHLRHHREEMLTIPQYHQIYELLCRGIAFHHSGLLPLLKEIVELLFSRGYVKLLFCTETFAVGLNMPTKTVLFAGLKKYDDRTDHHRMLRHDEYFQMAGRAGRRGKDDKGVVLYVPDREPVTAIELHTMMTGGQPELESRMDFHYDFLLKTIQATPSGEPARWLSLLEQSYWSRQQKEYAAQLRKERDELVQQRDAIQIEETLYEGCVARSDLERNIRTTYPSSVKKDLQRQLDTLKNRQLGPKWTKAWEEYHRREKIIKQIEEKEAQIEELDHPEEYIHTLLSLLSEMGYLHLEDPSQCTRDHLTLKGILATEINEAHPILLTELYLSDAFKELSGSEMVEVLAAFHEEKETDHPPIESLSVSSGVKKAIQFLTNTAKEMDKKEAKEEMGLEGYWATQTSWIEPISRWLQGESASVLCAEYEIYEGNFLRILHKTANMVEEVLSLATYCQHTEVIEKLIAIRPLLLRDMGISDSLYLHL